MNIRIKYDSASSTFSIVKTTGDEYFTVAMGDTFNYDSYSEINIDIDIDDIGYNGTYYPDTMEGIDSDGA